MGLELAAKTTIILAVAMAVAMGGAMTTAGYIMTKSNEAADAELARSDAVSVRTAIESDLEELSWTAREMVHVAGALFGPGGGGAGGGGNQSDGAPGGQNMSATEQLFVSLFLANRLDAMYIVGDEGPLMGFRLDLANQTFGNVSTLELAEMGNAGFDNLGALTLASSVLSGHEGACLAAGYRMDFGSAQMPGGSMVLVVTRPMDAQYVQLLEHETGHDITIEPAPPYAEDGTIQTQAISSTDQEATFMMAAASGSPGAMVTVATDRPITAQGAESFQALLYVGFAITVTALVVSLFWLGRSVTGRIKNLSQDIKAIGDADDFDGRLTVTGNDEVTHLGTSFNDLLEHVAAGRRSLEHRNADLQRFASGVSHDLRSPLSTFRLNLHLLKQRLVPDDASDGPGAADATAARAAAKDAERIARMLRSVDRMDERIGEMLAEARHAPGGTANAAAFTQGADLEAAAHQAAHAAAQDGGQQGDAAAAGGANSDVVDLNAVLGDVEHDLHSRLHEAGGTLTIGDLPTVAGSPGPLARLFQNIIENSIKYHRPGQAPRIRVHAQSRGEGVRIHVDDNGRGFANADVPRMFAYQARLDNVGDREGVGVGLAACLAIAKRHGGNITAQGKPGVGARLTIDLPAASQGSPRPEGMTPAAAPPAQSAAAPGEARPLRPHWLRRSAHHPADGLDGAHGATATATGTRPTRRHDTGAGQPGQS